MLAKICIFSVLAFAVFARADRDLWETSIDVSGWGSRLYFNATGNSDYDSDNEHVIPSDDCEGITSKACQNFNELRVNGINQQINKELTASYVYMAMGTYFSRDDPNHKGFAEFFFKASAEERDHAMKLIEYQNDRGGQVRLMSISAPSKHEWAHGLEAMEEALALEKEVNKSLLKLHQLAEDDPHMQDFLDTHYLSEQVESIRQLAGFVSKLRRLRADNPGLGEHIFDKELKG